MVKKEKTLVILEKTFKPGFGVVPFSILKNPKIPSYLKALYILLLSYAWYEAECFPGQERLGKELGLTKNSIRSQLKKLKELGLLDWKQRGLGKTNIYYLLEIPNKLLPDHKSTCFQKHKSSCDKLDEVELDKVNNNNFSLSKKSRLSKNKTYKKNYEQAYPLSQFLEEYNHLKSKEVLTEAVKYYIDCYSDKVGIFPPNIKVGQWVDVETNLNVFQGEWGLTEEDWVELINQWFKKRKGTDFNIIHFATGTIMENCARNAGVF